MTIYSVKIKFVFGFLQQQKIHPAVFYKKYDLFYS
ncbi:hypothetical protein SAMN04488023_14319 [Pedobacter rhizosphaerae]|uniref:Uncharacterized protein n=1 Tax=Pedobacter rhizosphaerae TaxID=390241 RepID=A0A1H9VIM0_9SPHI|nr:hypothetical protein SAMN04488023_14319 [Pedobacter rhizosphaerae]